MSVGSVESPIKSNKTGLYGAFRTVKTVRIPSMARQKQNRHPRIDVSAWNVW